MDRLMEGEIVSKTGDIPLQSVGGLLADCADLPMIPSFELDGEIISDPEGMPVIKFELFKLLLSSSSIEQLWVTLLRLSLVLMCTLIITMIVIIIMIMIINVIIIIIDIINIK